MTTCLGCRVVTDAITDLADAVATVLDRGLSEGESIAAMRPAMDRFLARAEERPVVPRVELGGRRQLHSVLMTEKLA